MNSSTSSKQNEGLPKPKGVKLKEKTIQGASRPVGGLEKAKSWHLNGMGKIKEQGKGK